MVKPLKLPEIYFDLRTSGFLMELIPGQFVALSESQVKDQLRLDGVEDLDVKDPSGLSKGNRMLAVAMRKKYVHYAGPLAGHKTGLYEMPGGKLILVTEPCKPTEPGKSSHCPNISNFIAQLCNQDTAQINTVLSWLKVALKSLRNGNFVPGQLLVLAGPPACGKTFFQWLVTQLFGGRSAKPYRYMTGQTQFNSDLAQAEHLPMGDVSASYDIRSRKNFASQIKEFCVEPEMSIHGKGKEAITLWTFRRLTLSVNNEPEHMLIIPPLDSDMLDKITLILCAHADLDEDRNENQKVFLKELPNFAAFLNEFTIPKPIRCPRFGVKSFHHPALLQIVAESAPEMQLLSVVDSVKPWGKPEEFWHGTAEELKILLLKSEHYQTVSTLLNWTAACGTYLDRLSRKFPDRFSRRINRGKTVWTIRADSESTDSEQQQQRKEKSA